MLWYIGKSYQRFIRCDNGIHHFEYAKVGICRKPGTWTLAEDCDRLNTRRRSRSGSKYILVCPD